MTGASWTFRPPAWATTGLIVACGAFCAAGFWQLNRAEEKRHLLREFDASDITAALPMPVADDSAEAYRYRTLHLAGQYDTEHQFLLDNIVLDGKVGYFVLTPLLGGDRAMLINRGWVAANPDRSVLPDVSVSADPRELTGLIAPLPAPGLRLDPGEPDPAAPWPRRRSFPSAAELRAQLGYAVAGYQLLLDPKLDDGFIRDWRPVIMIPEKHLSYAVQWFGLAITLFCIYIAVNLKRISGVQGK